MGKKCVKINKYAKYVQYNWRWFNKNDLNHAHFWSNTYNKCVILHAYKSVILTLINNVIVEMGAT